MTYATPSDLIARFGEAELIQQTDLEGTGAFDPDTVERALNDATARINGYVSSRYTLPLAAVPDLLVSICCDLARYLLYVDAVPDLVKTRRDDAVAALRDVAAGRVHLDVGAAGDDAAPTTAGLAQVVQAGRKVFRGGL